MFWIKSVTGSKNVRLSLKEALDAYHLQDWQLCLNGTVSIIDSHELHARKEELVLAFWYASAK